MKYIISVLLVVAFCDCGADKLTVVRMKDYYASNTQNRIVYGTPALAGDFPWQVLIIGNMIGFEMYCGGAIIDATTILTAGHCTSEPVVHFEIYAGGLSSLSSSEPGRVTVTANRSYTHSGYNSQTLENDVGVIKLDSPLEFTDRIQPVRLPSKGETIESGVTVRVSGWGVVSDQTNATLSAYLNWVNLVTITNQECAETFDNIKNSTLCAVGYPIHSTCHGDSGGALVVLAKGTFTHVGVVSFVSDLGCTLSQPSGYVRTEAVLEWILEHSSGNFLSISNILLAIAAFVKILSL